MGEGELLAVRILDRLNSLYALESSTDFKVAGNIYRVGTGWVADSCRRRAVTINGCAINPMRDRSGLAPDSVSTCFRPG